MSDSIGFLLSDVARSLRRRFDERARLIGVTRPQWRALVTLSRNEGINQGGLAELLEVEPITLCRMIDRLEESALVERRRDPADRRAWRIHLTPASLPLIERLHVIADQVVGEALDGLDDAQREQLATVLGQIRTNLLAAPTAKETAHG